MAVLNDLELSEAVASLGAGWSVQAGALHKRYDVPDFAASMALANRVADAAEQADHHPDMLVGWGRLELSWASHSEGGITERDVTMARRSDELATSS
ncbi:MAG TPA: 4a-hydroxytetrahydrobiopterin dehydratase [Gaiellales bacterium]|nr:4a-hydroxytetrahydrobiopterin dehydratase [Gaiellales bacterium]